MNVDFQIKVLFLAFGITVGLAIVFIPILRRLKIGQNERDDGPKSHIKKQGTPTMGRFNNDDKHYYLFNRWIYLL